MPDIRNYNNPWEPRFSKSNQEKQLAGESYVEDKTGRVIDALIRSIRKGTIVEVVEVGLLAPVSGRPSKRRKLLAERFEQIRERGGVIVEKSTGQKSVGNYAKMLMRGYEFIASSGRTRNKQGRAGHPGIQLTPHEKTVIEGIWTSRRFKNDDSRLVEIEKRTGKKLKRGWVWTHFGSPSGQKSTDNK